MQITLELSELREIVFQAAGAATAPLMQDHPDYVFPSQRVADAVEYTLQSFRIGGHQSGYRESTTEANLGKDPNN